MDNSVVVQALAAYYNEVDDPPADSIRVDRRSVIYDKSRGAFRAKVTTVINCPTPKSHTVALLTKLDQSGNVIKSTVQYQ